MSAKLFLATAVLLSAEMSFLLLKFYLCISQNCEIT